jgi:hypothetical protein
MPSTSPPSRAGTGVKRTNVVAFPTKVWFMVNRLVKQK